MLNPLLRLLLGSAVSLTCIGALAQPGLGSPVVSSAFGSGVDTSGDGAVVIQPAGIPVHSLIQPSARSAQILDGLQPEPLAVRRGAREVSLYRKVSPAVVLIVTKTGLGSGTLLNANGDILTNWHVVGSNATVDVVFKPQQGGGQITKADVRLAEVLRIDEVADLALIRVKRIPPGVEPVPLGQGNEIEVGSDVHAIGHPTGETWTYTKGVVSAVRPDYKWTTDDRTQHHATVIQTQTPINPGNSGGPLLTDDGKLIGVNSFKAKGEALNFAVAVGEVRRFLSGNASRAAGRSQPQGTTASAGAGCKPRALYQRENKTDGIRITGVDLNCDGEVDAELRVPVDPKEPMVYAFDRNGDGRPDVLVFSERREAYWELSLWDNDFDGKWDMVGIHEKGEIEPTYYETYSRWSARVAKRAR